MPCRKHRWALHVVVAITPFIADTLLARLQVAIYGPGGPVDLDLCCDSLVGMMSMSWDCEHLQYLSLLFTYYHVLRSVASRTVHLANCLG